MMCQFVNVLDVTVLPVYRPSEEEISRPELFAANVRAVYLEASGMRAAEQSQREFIALTKVGSVRVQGSGSGSGPLNVIWERPVGLIDGDGTVCVHPCHALSGSQSEGRVRGRAEFANSRSSSRSATVSR